MATATPRPIPAISGGRPLFENPVPFLKPGLPPLKAVMRSYRTAYSRGLLTNGELVSALEHQVAERLCVRHCIAVSSCTSGLMILFRALDLRGSVILPSFTFFATGHALLWNGLRPVFADCDARTWTIDPDDVRRKITVRTSAILGVHVYGNPCAVDSLQNISTSAGVKLIFDAAHAFGSSYQGRAVGGFGDAEVFSLSPTKPLISGEGGLVATNDGTLARRLRAARNYGDSGTYDCELLGINARMSEFQAALALAGLRTVDAKIRRHNEIAAKFTELMGGLPGAGFQQVLPGNLSSRKDYSVRIAPEFGMDRDELAVALAAENIPTKKYFSPPLHRQRLYRKFWAGGDDLKNTDLVSREVLSLCIYDSLKTETVERISYGIRQFAGCR